MKEHNLKIHPKHFKDIVGIVLDVKYTNRYKNSILTQKGNPFFQTDISKPIWDGGYALFTAVQVAYFMGINPVVLLGVDHYINDNLGIDSWGIRLIR